MSIYQLFLSVNSHLVRSTDFSEPLNYFDPYPLSVLDFSESGLKIKQMLESVYTDGITGLDNVEVKGKNIVGTFSDYISPTLTNKFSFEITPDNVSYQLINPGSANYSESLDFARVAKPKAVVDSALQTKADKSGRTRNCTTGKTMPCGARCQAIGKPCKGQPLAPELKQVQAEVVDNFKKDLAKVKKENPAKKVSKLVQDTAKVATPSNVETSKTENKPAKGDSKLRDEDYDTLTRANFDKLGFPNTAISRFDLGGIYGKNKAKPTEAIANKFFGDTVLLEHLATANSGKGVLGKKVADAANRYALNLYSLASDEVKNHLADTWQAQEHDKQVAKTQHGSARAEIYKDLASRKRDIDAEREAKDRNKNSSKDGQDKGKDGLESLLGLDSDSKDTSKGGQDKQRSASVSANEKTPAPKKSKDAETTTTTTTTKPASTDSNFQQYTKDARLPSGLNKILLKKFDPKPPSDRQVIEDKTDKWLSKRGYDNEKNGARPKLYEHDMTHILLHEMVGLSSEEMDGAELTGKKGTGPNNFEEAMQRNLMRLAYSPNLSFEDFTSKGFGYNKEAKESDYPSSYSKEDVKKNMEFDNNKHFLQKEVLRRIYYNPHREQYLKDVKQYASSNVKNIGDMF